MARMLLYLDKPRQPDADSNITEIFPIYELDYNAAIEAGVDITIDWDTRCTNSVNDCYAITLSSTDVNLSRYFSTNAPHQAWQDGSILKGRMSPYVQDGETGIYDLDSTYYNFEPIQTGTRPDDWGVASNIVAYFMPPAFTYNNTQYRYKLWYNVRKDSNWISSNQYFYDTNRSIIKQFYTENGYSFGCYCGGNDYSSSGSTNSPYCCLIGHSQGTDGMDNLSAARYTFTNPAGTVLSYTNGRAGLAMNCSSVSTSSNEDKANCLLGNDIRRSWTQVFFHMVYNDRDYYGVLGLRCSGFSEDAPYASFYGCAFTSEFWGDSIIAGGGGGGSWGPPSMSGGGSGTFEISRQDNRGDPDGHGVADRADAIRSALDPFFAGANGLKLHQLLSAAIPDIYALLYSDTSGAFLRRYEQSMYNPLSAVVSVHMLPEKLVLMTGSSSDLTASGYNISNNLPTPLQFPIVSSTASYPQKINGVYGPGLDSFDFEKYFDAFPDFAPYTQIRLHLPYCGVIDIDTNLVMHGTLQVSYICDAISGNVAAYVYCKDKDGNSTYSYVATGNAAFSLPMFAAQQDGSSVGKLGMSLVGLGISAATGNAAGITGGLAGAAGAVYDAATARRTTQITGQYSGNAGALTDTVCWLEITRPVWAEPDNYQMLHGETSQIGGSIANYADGLPYSGYLQVQQIDADGINATRSEIDEIEQILKSGIYVNDQ